MKHYTDLTKEEQAVFADKLGKDLEEFFSKLSKDYQLCHVCLHSAVIRMCENFIEDLLEGSDGTKH